jgi:hypothetical protein
MSQSSYQKLKEQNLELRSDLIELASNPESKRSASIKLQYAMIGAIEKSVFVGSVTMEKRFKGVFSQIIK